MGIRRRIGSIWTQAAAHFRQQGLRGALGWVMERSGKRIQGYIREGRVLGVFGAPAIRCWLWSHAAGAKARNERPQRGVVVRNLGRTVEVRAQSSDFLVLRQVLVDEEYACVLGIAPPRLIIDCGANVGYTVVYLAHHFPDAKLIAVEPDPANVEQCRRNLAAFGQRASARQTGIWSHPAGLKVERTGFGDGMDWSFWVREIRGDEPPDVMAVDIGTLLAASGEERIGLLKIDIERSEIELFSNHYSSWIGKVDNIAIELHGPDCQEAFFKALEPFEYTVVQRGEITACLGIRPKTRQAGRAERGPSAFTPGWRRQSRSAGMGRRSMRRYA